MFSVENDDETKNRIKIYPVVHTAEVEMSEKRTFKVGINETIVDKPADPKRPNSAINWRSLDLDEEALISQIQSGYALSAHFREGHRKTQNFVCSDFIAADIDGPMSVESALQFDFVKKFAAFLYTTPSHAQDRHRFRIVFLLEETLCSSDDWKNSLLGLAVKVGGDLSIKDAGRMFYGNRLAEIHRLGNLLPQKEVSALIAMGVDERTRAIRKVQAIPMRSSMVMDAKALVQTSSGTWVSFKDLPTRTSVLCPFHMDTHPSAFVVKSQNGLSTGIHCMTCNATFWAGEHDGYDFDAFDQLAAERAKVDHERWQEREASAGIFEQYFPPEPSLEVIQKRYLPNLNYRPGITMVKSPKGSGKTEALGALLDQIRNKNFPPDLARKDRPKSILLVGHRRSLISEAAKKLRLACYLDKHEPEEKEDGFATCLDSLHHLTHPLRGKALRYDVLILDESEQVFSHLTGETITQKEGGAYKAYLALKAVIQQAKAVYALDADLGLISAHTLKELRPDDWQKNCCLIVNKPLAIADRRPIYLYQSKNDLEAKLVSAVKEGKRCLVVSNSKAAVDTLEEIIEKRCGASVKRQKVTSENSQETKVKDFVENIKTEFLKIQVLICSPSLGTGVDITFPDGEQKVDHVFGFFYSNINTHTDIDQQIARVRNPGAVSVWFDRRRSSFETNFDVIRDDLVRGFWVPAAVTDTGDDGRLDYDKNNPLLLIWSHVICAQRSSKNKLVELFTRLREANGWDVQLVKKGETSEPNKSAWKEAKAEIRSRRISGIMDAVDLPDHEVLELYERSRTQGMGQGQDLTEQQRYQLDRGRLRMSFGVPITHQLIAMEEDGRLGERVTRFKACFDEHIGLVVSGILSDLKKEAGALKKTSHGVLLHVMMTVVGLFKDGVLNEAARLTKNDLQAFVAICRSNKTIIEEMSGFEIRGDLKKNPIRTLNEFLGLIGLSLIDVGRKRNNGTIVRIYALDGDKLEQMRELAQNFREFDRLAQRPVA